MVSWRGGRGRGRCVTSEEVRLGRPASELADCGRPNASRGAALLERGGPTCRGRGRCWGDRDCRYGSILTVRCYKMLHTQHQRPLY